MNLFNWWRSLNLSDATVYADLNNDDPFVQARSLYLNFLRKQIGQQKLHESARSEHWPLRMVALCCDPFLLKDAPEEHVLWLSAHSSGEPKHHGESLIHREQSSSNDELACNWLKIGFPSFLSVNIIDGSIMVYVPKGAFEMGDDNDKNCAKHKVYLSGFWMSVYCVTNAQYAKFIEVTGHRPPNKPKYGTQVWMGKQFSREKALHPVLNISWDDAHEYSLWARCQLPTEAQWEKAAKGPKELIYPWGNDWHQEKCNSFHNRGTESIVPVHGYPEGVSSYGCYNLSGNVWEWCADWYGNDYYHSSIQRDPKGPIHGQMRVLRGGSVGNVDPIAFRCANRGKNNPGDHHDSYGFRLVRSV